MRSVKVLSTVAAIGSFAVIVLGKIVRVTGASTSIPDWPLAFGQLVPKMTPLVFWEWSHRLLGELCRAAVTTLIVYFVALRAKISSPRSLSPSRFLATASPSARTLIPW